MPSDAEESPCGAEGDHRIRNDLTGLTGAGRFSNTSDDSIRDFPPYASEWKKPPGSRRASWRSAFSTSPGKRSLLRDPVIDTLKGSPVPFCFQKRRTRIDWRALHTIDVDQIIRETDTNTLENVLDTVAFGDIQGEDTRNFTETNFVKLFRLAQLMVEYLLYMQDLLASQKSHLMEAGSTLYKRADKFRQRCVWQNEALWQSRRDLKRTKKTLHTYESLLQAQGHVLPIAGGRIQSIEPKEAHHCAFCEKIFESASYLDMHISRRHAGSKELLLERRNLEDTSKAENPSATVVSSLQTALKESNEKLKDVQNQLNDLQKTMKNPKQPRKDVGDKLEEDKKAIEAQEKLRELEVKFGHFESQIKQLGQENGKLLKELNAAYSEVSGLKSEKRRFALSMDRHEEQVEELQQEIEELRKSLRKENVQPSAEKKNNPIKASEWLKEAEHYHSKENCNALTLTKRPLQEDSQVKQAALNMLREMPVRKEAAKRIGAVEDLGPQRATVDVLTNAEEDIPPDKERWLKLHPYTPIPSLPYAIAKYPHSPALFTSKRTDVSRRLDRLLREELKKYGIPPHAEGISDAKYAVVAAARDKQQAFRLSRLPANERKIMEYERSTVLWQIERAVHTRDMSILESILDEETDSTSPNDGNMDKASSGEPEEGNLMQSPIHRASRHQYELDVESRSTPRQESEQVVAFGQQHIQPIDGNAITRKSLTKYNLDDLERQTSHVVGQLTALTSAPSSPPWKPPQHNVALSAVSSPTNTAPPRLSEAPEEEANLRDWESDDAGSSFVNSSSSMKREQHDAASASSKTTAKL